MSPTVVGIDLRSEFARLQRERAEAVARAQLLEIQVKQLGLRCWGLEQALVSQSVGILLAHRGGRA